MPRSAGLVAGTAAGVVALLVCAGYGIRWWTHPTLFGSLGDGIAVEPRPVARAALSTGVTFPHVDGEPETITIQGATAVFARNSAKAVATFSICHLSEGESPIGSAHDPAAHCRDLEPLEPGAAFRQGTADTSGGEGDYLLLTLTPTTPGATHVSRVEVTYQRGLGHLYQRGTESIAADRRLTATAVTTR